MKKIIIPLFLSSSLLLQGCAVGLVAAGGAAGTTAANDKRSFSTMFDDEDITYRAERRLAGDTEITEQTHVVAATYDHNVLLVGEAPTEALREKAYRVVKNGDPKIKKIYNLIEIAQPINGLTRSNDALITTNVKARMIATTNIKASQFKVVTENSVVYLMGSTTREQADIAAEIARNSSGVKKVVKVIQYTN